MMNAKDDLEKLQKEIVNCTRCPRLVEWREQVAKEKVRRFAHEQYWGRPITGFGDPYARLLIIGLAPAAHGGNRTGRIFTGDRSGDWLIRTLHKCGFANQPVSVNRSDGLQLHDCYITAAIRCAPPANKPTGQEIQNCRPFLLRELELLLPRLRAVVALGQIAFRTALDALAEVADVRHNPRPKFAHGAEIPLTDKITLLASYHPSQQNTFTGRLTEEMLDAVFLRALEIVQASEPQGTRRKRKAR
jgi:uracil-DNA glycosylase family 4